MHCLGHSFGGRFLTAAVNAAAAPQPRTLTLMNSVSQSGRMVLAASDPQKFKFTVDSMLVFQMAAPCSKFAPRLCKLIHDAPFRGPLVTTFSDSDTANCAWHRRAEGEDGIGCSGATERIKTSLPSSLPSCLTTTLHRIFPRPSSTWMLLTSSIRVAFGNRRARTPTSFMKNLSTYC